MGDVGPYDQQLSLYKKSAALPRLAISTFPSSRYFACLAVDTHALLIEAGRPSHLVKYEKVFTFAETIKRVSLLILLAVPVEPSVQSSACSP